MLLKTLLLCCLVVELCTAYPSGAPLDRCESMMPGHGVDPINDTPPFAITVSPIDSSPSFNGNFKLDFGPKMTPHL